MYKNCCFFGFISIFAVLSQGVLEAKGETDAHRLLHNAQKQCGSKTIRNKIGKRSKKSRCKRVANTISTINISAMPQNLSEAMLALLKSKEQKKALSGQFYKTFFTVVRKNKTDELKRVLKRAVLKKNKTLFHAMRRDLSRLNDYIQLLNEQKIYFMHQLINANSEPVALSPPVPAPPLPEPQKPGAPPNSSSADSFVVPSSASTALRAASGIAPPPPPPPSKPCGKAPPPPPPPPKPGGKAPPPPPSPPPKPGGKAPPPPPGAAPVVVPSSAPAPQELPGEKLFTKIVQNPNIQKYLNLTEYFQKRAKDSQRLPLTHLVVQEISAAVESLKAGIKLLCLESDLAQLVKIDAGAILDQDGKASKTTIVSVIMDLLKGDSFFKGEIHISEANKEIILKRIMGIRDKFTLAWLKEERSKALRAQVRSKVLPVQAQPSAPAKPSHLFSLNDVKDAGSQWDNYKEVLKMRWGYYSSAIMTALKKEADAFAPTVTDKKIDIGLVQSTWDAFCSQEWTKVENKAWGDYVRYTGMSKQFKGTEQVVLPDQKLEAVASYDSARYYSYKISCYVEESLGEAQAERERMSKNLNTLTQAIEEHNSMLRAPSDFIVGYLRPLSSDKTDLKLLDMTEDDVSYYVWKMVPQIPAFKSAIKELSTACLAIVKLDKPVSDAMQSLDYAQRQLSGLDIPAKTAAQSLDNAQQALSDFNKKNSGLKATTIQTKKRAALETTVRDAEKALKDASASRELLDQTIVPALEAKVIEAEQVLGNARASRASLDQTIVSALEKKVQDAESKLKAAWDSVILKAKDQLSKHDAKIAILSQLQALIKSVESSGTLLRDITVGGFSATNITPPTAAETPVVGKLTRPLQQDATGTPLPSTTTPGKVTVAPGAPPPPPPPPPGKVTVGAGAPPPPPPPPGRVKVGAGAPPPPPPPRR